MSRSNILVYRSSPTQEGDRHVEHDLGSFGISWESVRVAAEFLSFVSIFTKRKSERKAEVEGSGGSGLCICGSTFMSHEFSRILTTHTTHTGLFFVVCLEVRAGDGSTKTKKPKKPKTILKVLCVCNIVRQYFLIRDTTICSKTSQVYDPFCFNIAL